MMDSQEASDENMNDAAARKERRKVQNTIAQRKYRNKQRQKTRELERLLSMSLTSTNQPCGSLGANAGPDPGPWITSSSQLYDEQAVLPSRTLAAMGPVADPCFNLDFGVVSSGCLTGFSPDSGTLSCDRLPYSLQTLIPTDNNMQCQPPRSFMEASTMENTSITEAYPSFPNTLQANLFKPVPEVNNASGSTPAFRPTLLKASQVLSSLCQDLERNLLVKMIGSEELNLRDIVKLGLASLGTTMDDTQYASANDKPADVWIEEVTAAYAPCDIQLAVWTGIRVILQMVAQGGRLEMEATFGRRGGQVHLQQNINLQANTITLKVSPWMSASLANAELLGITYESLMLDSSESPFTQKQIAPLQFSRNITTSMTPTMVQYTKSHHPYLDLIPWPTFRSKAIIAISVTPPLIDEEDLCLDLMNNALRCWGSIRSQHGRGEGTPWDMRSWEAAPWFMTKWAMLVDGDGGEIARNSAWWRNQRGMSSLD